MTQYWFKPKTYGYGATPVTWQGWLVTLGAVAFIMGLTHVMIVGPQIARTGPDFPAVAMWAALVALSILGLLWISRTKTDGTWKWRWGSD